MLEHASHTMSWLEKYPDEHDDMHCVPTKLPVTHVTHYVSAVHYRQGYLQLVQNAPSLYVYSGH